MSGEALWELVKVFSAALVASALTHFLTHRRFIRERWWDRKADAYGSIIASLVSMALALRLWIEHEWSDEYKETPQKVINEYGEIVNRIERAVTEGDYVISKKASNALAELLGALKEVPTTRIVTQWSFVTCLEGYREAVESCLDTMRDEAKSHLGLKWWSL